MTLDTPAALAAFWSDYCAPAVDAQPGIEWAATAFLDQAGMVMGHRLESDCASGWCRIASKSALREAVTTKAAKLAILHWHPAPGTSTPSEADISVAASMRGVLPMLGLELVEFAIVSESGIVSFRESGWFSTVAKAEKTSREERAVAAMEEALHLVLDGDDILETIAHEAAATSGGTPAEWAVALLRNAIANLAASPPPLRFEMFADLHKVSPEAALAGADAAREAGHPPCDYLWGEAVNLLAERFSR